jgi:hypothetical protein
MIGSVTAGTKRIKNVPVYKMAIKEIGWKFMGRIRLSQDTD